MDEEKYDQCNSPKCVVQGETQTGTEHVGDKNADAEKKDAYFLDNDTIFIAKIPSDWYEVLEYNSLEFICMDSGKFGVLDTNFFTLQLVKYPKEKYFEGYEKTVFRYTDGQEGYRFVKKFKEDGDNTEYYRENIVMPDGRFMTNLNGCGIFMLRRNATSRIEGRLRNSITALNIRWEGSGLAKQTRGI